MKGIDQKVIHNIVERPKFLDELKGGRGGKIALVAETLKLMEKTKALCYDENEFNKEFSSNKGYISYMKASLIKFGIKKPRIVKLEGRVWIWRNE